MSKRKARAMAQLAIERAEDARFAAISALKQASAQSYPSDEFSWGVSNYGDFDSVPLSKPGKVRCNGGWRTVPRTGSSVSHRDY